MSSPMFVRQLARYSVCPEGAVQDPFIQEIFQETIPDALPLLNEYSRSLYTEEKHLESFFKYTRSHHYMREIDHELNFSPHIRHALDIVENVMTPFLSCDAISMHNLDLVKYEPSTSAGYGYYGLKRDNYLLARARATANFNNWKEAKTGKTFRFTPSMAFARTQLALVCEPKIRHVFGSAFHNILIEGTVAYPLLQRIISMPDCPWFIGHIVYKDIPAYVLASHSPDDTYYCVDFSGFDACVHPFFISKFFALLKRTVKFADPDGALVLDYCKELLLNHPVLLPDGRLYIMQHGLPSGSYFTQLIGSYVNHVISMAAHLSLGYCFRTGIFLGDDSLVLSKSNFSIDQFATFFERIGFKVNFTKTIISKSLQDVYTLGHNFRGSRLTRDDFTIACLLIHMERGTVTLEESYVRVLSLLVDSCYGSNIPFQLSQIYKSRYHLTEPLSFGIAPWYIGLFALT